jgi:serine/threonine protein phosphatase PrpC
VHIQFVKDFFILGTDKKMNPEISKAGTHPTQNSTGSSLNNSAPTTLFTSQSTKNNKVFLYLNHPTVHQHPGGAGAFTQGNGDDAPSKDQERWQAARLRDFRVVIDQDATAAKTVADRFATQGEAAAEKLSADRLDTQDKAANAGFDEPRAEISDFSPLKNIFSADLDAEALTKPIKIEMKDDRHATVTFTQNESTREWLPAKVFARGYRHEGTTAITCETLDKTGTARAKGLRTGMEDQCIATSFTLLIEEKQIQVSVRGVFDGHGGKYCAKRHAKPYYPEVLKQCFMYFNPKGEALTDEKIYNALKIAGVVLNDSLREYYKNFQNWRLGDITRFLSPFNALQAPPNRNSIVSGTTANISLCMNGDTYVSNIGDSRAIHVTQKKITQLSEDASLTVEKYKKSVEARGGEVEDGRIVATIPLNSWGYTGQGPALNVARAVGSNHVPGVTARPKLTKAPKIDSKDGYAYIVHVCDGVTSVMSSQQIGQLVQEQAEKQASPTKIAAVLVAAAYALGSTDNLSAVVAPLPLTESTKA